MDEKRFSAALDELLKKKAKGESPPNDLNSYLPGVQVKTDDYVYETFEGDFEAIQQWRGYEPSKINAKEDKVQSFVYENPHYVKRGDRKNPLELKELNEIKKKFLYEKKVTEKLILQTAKEHKHTSGKWMAYVSKTEDMDKAWQNVLRAVNDRKFRFVDRIVKVTITVNDEWSTYPPRINLVTDDFTDKLATTAIGTLFLKVLGGKVSKGKIRYKPDIYTDLKIDASNPYKICPSIFTEPPKNPDSRYKNFDMDIRRPVNEQ